MRKLPCDVVMGSQALGAEGCQDLQCLLLANRNTAAAILIVHGQQLCAVTLNLERCLLYCCCHLHICLLYGSTLVALSVCRLRSSNRQGQLDMQDAVMCFGVTCPIWLRSLQ